MCSPDVNPPPPPAAAPLPPIPGATGVKRRRPAISRTGGMVSLRNLRIPNPGGAGTNYGQGNGQS